MCFLSNEPRLEWPEERVNNSENVQNEAPSFIHSRHRHLSHSYTDDALEVTFLTHYLTVTSNTFSCDYDLLNLSYVLQPFRNQQIY